ncbi:MAG: DUF6614 family protein [Pseudomonadales bacterium]
MDIYHIWCDLQPGQDDLEFVRATRAYLDHLQARGALHGYRITRRKLGLAPADLGEFHMMLEFTDLAQLDDAFGRAAARRDPVEALHRAVNQRVQGARFALYRDFPDPGRDAQGA